MAGTSMNPYLTVDEVIERAIAMIASHELFKTPIVKNKAGLPMRITRIYDFDNRIDNNTDGLTLCIFPYAYEGTSNETVGSTNAAVTYQDYHPGAAKRGFDQGRIALVIRLQTAGHDQEETPPPYTGSPVVYRNWKEKMLRRWATILRNILLTKPLENLGGLVQNSHVNYLSFRTSNPLADRGKAMVFHSAGVLWELYFNAPRNFKSYPVAPLIPDPDYEKTWSFIGVRNRELDPVYWDSYHGFITVVGGHPLHFTPKGTPVVWDKATSQFKHTTTGVVLTSTELEDTRLNPVKPWINTDLLIVGVMLPSRTNLYWHKTLNQLQLADGTVITELEDGTPISYDPVRGVLYRTDDPDQVPLDPASNIIPLNRSVVNIYEAGGLTLRDTFEL